MTLNWAPWSKVNRYDLDALIWGQTLWLWHPDIRSNAITLTLRPWPKVQQLWPWPKVNLYDLDLLTDLDPAVHAVLAQGLEEQVEEEGLVGRPLQLRVDHLTVQRHVEPVCRAVSAQPHTHTTSRTILNIENTSGTRLRIFKYDLQKIRVHSLYDRFGVFFTLSFVWRSFKEKLKVTLTRLPWPGRAAWEPGALCWSWPCVRLCTVSPSAGPSSPAPLQGSIGVWGCYGIWGYFIECFEQTRICLYWNFLFEIFLK